MHIRKEIGKNPYIDWTLIGFITFVITIILVAWGFSLYNAVTKGDIQGTPNKSNISKTFDAKTIENTVKYFVQREDLSNKAKDGYSGLPDPSL